MTDFSYHGQPNQNRLNAYVWHIPIGFLRVAGIFTDIHLPTKTSTIHKVDIPYHGSDGFWNYLHLAQLYGKLVGEYTVRLIDPIMAYG